MHLEFGLYVDRHGDPSRTVQTIEWEGTAEHVAWHPPYVLLFDSRFIEIRHVETGRLAQIIPGDDVRCIWDGRGTTTNVPATPGPEGWSEGMSQEPRVHGVMNAESSTPEEQRDRPHRSRRESERRERGPSTREKEKKSSFFGSLMKAFK